MLLYAILRYEPCANTEVGQQYLLDYPLLD
jgi:hypothetical protein